MWPHSTHLSDKSTSSDIVIAVGLVEELPKQITTRGDDEKFAYRITGNVLSVSSSLNLE